MKRSELPVSWYGLSDAETLAVLPHVWGVRKCAASRVAVLKTLLNHRDFLALSADDATELTDNDLAFLWEDDIEGLPFASFRVDGIDYELPENGIDNLSLQEFINCIFCFLEFTDACKNPENTAALTEPANALAFNVARPSGSTSRLPPDWNGDNREAYNEFVCADRAKNTVVPLVVAVAITRWFGSELKSYYDRYDILEDPSPDNGSETENETTWVEAAMAWKNTHFELSQDRALGDFWAISKITMPDIGMYLTKLKQQAKARELAERMAQINAHGNPNSD